ncbi:hypothetical protein GCM10008018_60430 [Paenibacillus marchantiophytorum]|uniref:Uncharacterized protein n=1 Tax=Paenibacillus marchantiophytorum TaxID=1619310 RepID=A0ABQ1FC94_9BACL|nr:hypothetical protein [Paenibacillus marchantiophytorum]GGA06477.1 hypothetical protein GCM10008018_60430 [Paenibacillus marchantiophytorum]
MSNYEVINTETGEVVTDQFSVARRRRLTDTQKVSARSANILSQLIVDNGGFVFALFKSEALTELGSLNNADMARLLYLGTFVGWENGKLRSDNGKDVYTKRDLPKLLGISRNKAHALYEKLTESDTLHTDDDGALYINTAYFYRGDNVEGLLASDEEDIRYTRIFKATVRFLYEDYGKARTASRLGVLYRILPYVNFAFNVICWNPRETESVDKLSAITVEALAEMLGYSKKQELTNTIDLMKTRNGDNLFCYFGSSSKTQGLIVNPYTIYAGNAKTLRLAEDLFKIARNMKPQKRGSGAA